MADKEVVETIYGKRHKYEVVKSNSGPLGGTTFSIHRDGSYFRGSYDSLSKAVEVAKGLD